MAHVLTIPPKKIQPPAFSKRIPNRVALDLTLVPTSLSYPPSVTAGTTISLTAQLYCNSSLTNTAELSWSFSCSDSTVTLTPSTVEASESTTAPQQVTVASVPSGDTNTSMSVIATCVHPVYGTAVSNPLVISIVPA